MAVKKYRALMMLTCSKQDESRESSIIEPGEVIVLDHLNDEEIQRLIDMGAVEPIRGSYKPKWPPEPEKVPEPKVEQGP